MAKNKLNQSQLAYLSSIADPKKRELLLKLMLRAADEQKNLGD